MSLMEEGKCRFASTCALTFSDDAMLHFMENIDFFRDKVLMRPGEISNSPEVVRRLGLIAANTALEADIYGNVNSTHVLGTKMMNGIGGSADFSRNAYLSIFSLPLHPERRKDLDHRPDGFARGPQRALREDPRHRAGCGRSPRSRPDAARTVHHRELRAPCMYKELMWDYLKIACRNGGHTPHDLRAAFAFHEASSRKATCRLSTSPNMTNNSFLHKQRADAP